MLLTLILVSITTGAATAAIILFMVYRWLKPTDQQKITKPKIFPLSAPESLVINRSDEQLWLEENPDQSVGRLHIPKT